MGATGLSPEQMRAFLAGGLSSEEEETVSQHLDACTRCEELAAGLSDDGEARQLASISHGAKSVGLDAPEIDDLRRRLHALGLFSVAAENESLSSELEQMGSGQTTVIGDSTRNDHRSGDDCIQSAAHQNVPPLSRLGRYSVLRVLGSGSFGVVYLAEDPRLNRRVAIKVARGNVLID